AARFAGVFFAVIGLTSCGFAGFNFLGRHHGRSVVLIHIGCIGRGIGQHKREKKWTDCQV
ncbi:hypothetical protein, partial [Neisseria gonorrhoeae]|uniref:hypothetical protein n=1 Tax=Neisseria gonorrhoeae TaxID=485 RepID=UPI000D4FF3A7